MTQSEYDSTVYVHEEDIILSKNTKELLKQATDVYNKNFDGKTWYGRCIFVSWYCSLQTCKFCYRTNSAHQDRHKQNMKRSMGSVLLEALFCRLFGWRIEFLTAGYGAMSFDEMCLYAELISIVYGEKIWLNIGSLSDEKIEQIKPFIKGVCGSIESPTPRVHEFMCPDKPLHPYEKMFERLEKHGLKKSAALIIGLGDTEEEFQYWIDFISKHKLDRITVYALKPIRDGPIPKGPTHDLYLSWIAKLRIAFPTLEIIGGTNLRRSEETKYMLQAGVNAFTKFPATKQFGTKKAHILENQVEKEKREFTSNLTKLPLIDWEEEIDSLAIPQEYKREMHDKLGPYLEKFKNPKDSDSAYRTCE